MVNSKLASMQVFAMAFACAQLGIADANALPGEVEQVLSPASLAEAQKSFDSSICEIVSGLASQDADSSASKQALRKLLRARQQMFDLASQAVAKNCPHASMRLQGLREQLLRPSEARICHARLGMLRQPGYCFVTLPKVQMK